MFCRKVFLFLCFLLGILWIQQVATDDDRPYLRILAPKFICNDKKANQTVNNNNNNLTISLQTREGQQLRYEIAVDFEMLSGFKSQQHTLSIWKNIRLLQKKFSKGSKEISQKNQIEIDSKELTSDVVYTFKIVGYDDTNRASEMQNCSITFKGGELKARQPEIGDGVSLLLFGSEFLYDDMIFLTVADVDFCDPIYDFTFKWEVDGFDSAELGSVVGNSLWFPSGTFKPGSQLEVVVKLLNAESMTMASARLPTKIISKDFQVSTAPAECLIGIDREIPFQAFLVRQESSAVTATKWICMKGDTVCDGMKPASNILGQLISFSSEGSFDIQTDVTISEVTKSSSTKVVVDSRVIPHVEIKIFPTQPVNVVQPNELIVTVQNLIPKCFASWNVITDQGFAMFNDIEGNFTDMGHVIIKDFEEHFLAELVDYDNNTLSKDVMLSIPENALKPEENYKFRLTVNCPVPIVEGAKPAPDGNVVSFFDIIISTNGPPQTLPLLVKPLVGVPMKTTFKFSTGAAKDMTSDFPLKYTFGYIVNNLTVIIETFYENTVTHSQLPFSDSIETFCEVCDNNKACRRIAGPTVAVTSEPKFSDDEIEFKLKEFEGTLRRAEFGKSFNLAVVFLLTQQKIVSDVSGFETKMLSMMKLEVEKLKSAGQSDTSKQKIVDFVKLSKGVMGLMTTADEAFVKQILGLTDLVKASETRSKRDASERTAKVLNHDPEYIKNVLSLSEILLKSKNATIMQQEKMKFVEKVHGFVNEMCSQNFDTQKIVSSSVAFEVSKIHSPQLSTEPLIMPENSATLLFSPNINFPAKFVCVAKIKFRIDMFQQEPSELQQLSVFETVVIDASAIGSSRVINATEVADSVNIEIPSTDSSMTCLLWNGATWSPDLCSKLKVNSTGKIGCNCKSVGITRYIFKAGKAALKPTETPEMSTKTIESTSQATATTIKDVTSSNPSPGAPLATEITTTGTKASEEIKETRTEVPMTLLTTSISQYPLSTTSPVTAAQITQTTKQSTFRTTLDVTTPGHVKPTISGTSEKAPLETDPTQMTAFSTTVGSSINGTSQTVAKADSSASWGLIFLLIIFFLVIIFLFFAHRCRARYNRSNLPMRAPANGLRYAKFHDEFILQG